MTTYVFIKSAPFERAVARQNLTYKQFAKRLGINTIYLSNMKNDSCPQYRPSGKLRQKMLRILNVGFDEIFVIRKLATPPRTNYKRKPKRK